MKKDDEKWVPGDPRDRECCGKCESNGSDGVEAKWWAMFWAVAVICLTVYGVFG